MDCQLSLPLEGLVSLSSSLLKELFIQSSNFLHTPSSDFNGTRGSFLTWLWGEQNPRLSPLPASGGEEKRPRAGGALRRSRQKVQISYTRSFRKPCSVLLHHFPLPSPVSGCCRAGLVLQSSSCCARHGLDTEDLALPTSFARSESASSFESRRPVESKCPSLLGVVFPPNSAKLLEHHQHITSKRSRASALTSRACLCRGVAGAQWDKCRGRVRADKPLAPVFGRMKSPYLAELGMEMFVGLWAGAGKRSTRWRGPGSQPLQAWSCVHLSRPPLFHPGFCSCSLVSPYGPGPQAWLSLSVSSSRPQCPVQPHTAVRPCTAYSGVEPYSLTA
ncbi:uncharacterized protein [Oryctolagus cuniculus]|uniref:uncharacterized protein n=1 Tax=Oryctolagus cuniculus TaxID=9986 RepID=UPI003879940B